MGFNKNVGLDKFPPQSKSVGHVVRVCFNYECEHTILGTIVRQDVDQPYRTIIQLSDGRYVTADECMYTPDVDGQRFIF